MEVKNYSQVGIKEAKHNNVICVISHNVISHGSDFVLGALDLQTSTTTE